MVKMPYAARLRMMPWDRRRITIRTMTEKDSGQVYDDDPMDTKEEEN